MDHSKKIPKIQLYQYVSEWLDTGKKFSGLIKKSACLFLPLNMGLSGLEWKLRNAMKESNV